jgi:hypothetical protein
VIQYPPRPSCAVLEGQQKVEALPVDTGAIAMGLAWPSPSRKKPMVVRPDRDRQHELGTEKVVVSSVLLGGE